MVPASREALDLLKARLQNVDKPDQAKYKVADSLNIPLSHGYNGQLTAHDAGKIGGELGGSMVKELIRSAQMALTANEQTGENKRTT
jgi:hypothetical protein